VLVDLKKNGRHFTKNISTMTDEKERSFNQENSLA
jgi:hypothetical protein